MRKNLNEWYEMDILGNGKETEEEKPVVVSVQQTDEPEEKSAESEIEKVDNFADLYKIMSLSKLIETKVSLLSGFVSVEDDKKEDLIKQIKKMAKEISSVADNI